MWPKDKPKTSIYIYFLRHSSGRLLSYWNWNFEQQFANADYYNSCDIASNRDGDGRSNLENNEGEWHSEYIRLFRLEARQENRQCEGERKSGPYHCLDRGKMSLKQGKKPMVVPYSTAGSYYQICIVQQAFEAENKLEACQKTGGPSGNGKEFWVMVITIDSTLSTDSRQSILRCLKISWVYISMRVSVSGFFKQHCLPDVLVEGNGGAIWKESTKNVNSTSWGGLW